VWVVKVLAAVSFVIGIVVDVIVGATSVAILIAGDRAARTKKRAPAPH
jgi:hypothetical protein